MLAGAEFIQKLEYKNSSEMSPIGDKKTVVLPVNESQVRPLIDCLKHQAQRQGSGR